jgi:hypothetical protein
VATAMETNHTTKATITPTIITTFLFEVIFFSYAPKSKIALYFVKIKNPEM